MVSRRTNSAARGRFLLIALAGLALVSGIWSGLARMGWALPLPDPRWIVLHGPLMVVGFLGGLIGLERAVALQRWWAYAIPVSAAASAFLPWFGAPVGISAPLAVLAALLLGAVFITLYRQYPSEHFIIMGLSALTWAIGSSVWFAGAPMFVVVPWWVSYLVLMIAGERLELSRLRQLPLFVRLAFDACVALILAGLVWSLFDLPASVRTCGAGFLLLALWLIRYDLVWQSARQPGLPRFMALSLIAGYLWLGAGGALWIIFAPYFSAGPRYDSMLHAIFLGFVFSMIFAHAPIILPTITGLALPFRPVFYLHAVVLHLSLFLRILGDAFLVLSFQRWGGLLNAGAILLFLANNVAAVRLGVRAQSGPRR